MQQSADEDIDSIKNLCYNFIARYEFNIELESSVCKPTWIHI